MTLAEFGQRTRKVAGPGAPSAAGYAEPQTPAPWLPPGLDEEAIKRAIDRCNKALLEATAKVRGHLYKTHEGFHDLPEGERAALYRVMPTEEQLAVLDALGSPGMAVDAQGVPQETPARRADFAGASESILAAPDPFVAWLVYFSTVDPEEAEWMARDAAKLGRKLTINQGKTRRSRRGGSPRGGY